MYKCNVNGLGSRSKNYYKLKTNNKKKNNNNNNHNNN